MPMNTEDLVTSGKITSQILQLLATKIKAGVNPIHLDSIALKLTKKNKAVPAFLNFEGYPNSICVSVNNILVHGLPSNGKFLPGDVVSVDFGVNYRGCYTDSAFTMQIPPRKKKIMELIINADKSLWDGIEKAKSGNKIFQISEAIEAVAHKNGYGIIHELTGHGIGDQLHLPPNIPNYNNNNQAVLKKGQVIAVEPMFGLFSDSKKNPNRADIKVSKDKWSVMLNNINIGVHFEHTIMITGDMPLVLTKPVDTTKFVW